MSSVDYHEGLQYVSQHYTPSAANAAYNASCGFDKDCVEEFSDSKCFTTTRCNPPAADGSKSLAGPIPGIYLRSPKGQAGPGSSILMFFNGQFSLMDMRRAGTAVRPAVYKGPDTSEGYDFAGWLALDMFQLAYWHRRLENCNFTDGKDLGDGLIDSQGVDCNQAKDTLTSQPLTGIPLFYMIDRDSTKPPGWDP